MIGRTIAHYRILELLGRGAMGEVYLAQDTTLPRKVALKLLPQETQGDRTSRSRLLREAQAAATITHPFICAIHELGEFEGTDYIAMEYVEGRTLKERLCQGPLSPEEALPLAAEMAEALEKAHGQGIVHRDLKPSNIMLADEGHPKIMDFGLAKRVASVEGVESQDQTQTELTQQGSTLGTPAYMSPEQVLGQSVDARSDIFSFGIVLYEMLTGAHPFQRPHAVETASAILRDEPVPLDRHLPGVSELLEHVVSKALAKDSGERYQSARELQVDLKRLAAGRTQARRVWPARRVVGRIAAALVLAIALVAAFLFWPSREGVIPERGLVPEGGTVSLVAIPTQVFASADEPWLTDAIPGSLTALLPREEWLQLKVPPTSFQVKQVQGDFAQIGSAYGVKLCVLSSVRVDAGRMTLSLQLADPSTRNILWNHSYQGERDNYNELLQQASLEILRALRPSASPMIRKTALAVTSEAERLLRKALHYSHRFNNRRAQEDFQTSLQDYRRALELDPDLDDAAAGIALLYIIQAESGFPATEAVVEVTAWANRALEISSRSPRAWVALSLAEEMQEHSNWRQRIQYAFKALQADFDHGVSHFALARSLPLAMSLPAFREAARRNPLHRYWLNAVADAEWRLGRASEALAVIDSVLTLEPDMPHALGNRCRWLIASGSLDEATVALGRVEDLVQRGYLAKHHLLELQVSLSAGSDEPSFEALFRNLLRQISDPQVPSNYVNDLSYDLGPILAEQGYRAEAIELMDLASSRGFSPHYDWLLMNPYLETLRDDPALADILSVSRDRFEELVSFLESAQLRGELPDYLASSFEEVLQLRRSLPDR